MPNSVVLLTLHGDRIEADIQLPISELQFAFGYAVNDSSARLVERLGPQLSAYIAQHIRPVSTDNRPWTVSVTNLSVQSTQNAINGIYKELTAHVWMKPPAGANTRKFTFNYDVIVHQVVTHKVLVSIRQDWEQGLLADQSPVQVGVIELDIPSGKIFPLQVNVASGSIWRGFMAMVQLGTEHIAEGTDHLLFLLVLLLPAPLLVQRNRWATFGGTRYSLIRLLRIVTAFTLGHSLTLLAGAMGWLRLPGQPVEILIAFSILVSAIHAIRPLFPGREAYVAAGFGLVHGLAFAGTLANLNLDSGRMALSILGFNLGIELMQLVVIALTVPWLILLSQTPIYPFVRLTGAVLSGVAALAWIAERVLNRPNPLTALVEQIAQHAIWLLAGLAFVAVLSSWWTRRKQSGQVGV